MTDPNENRPGYIKTKLGWLPKDWSTAKGAEIAATISKGASPKWQGFEYADSGMLFVTSENVRDGALDISKPKYLPLAFHKKLKRTQIRQHDILINLVGASIGRSCRVTRDLGPANVNQAVAVLRLRDKSQVGFVSYFLQAPNTVRRILDMQVDAARPNISLTDLRAFLFPLPPQPERDRIVAVLNTADDAIEQTRGLIEAKKQQKKALMQQLLTGKRRLPGFEGRTHEAKHIGSLAANWPLHPLSDVFAKVTRKNTDGVTLVLTASGDSGLVDQRTFFTKSIASADVSGYYLLRRGEFAYNRSAMNGYPNGAIKRLDAHDQGVLSTLYSCFAIRPDRGDSDFYLHFFEAGLLNRQLRRITQVGGRAHGLLNITDSDFYSVSIPVPDLSEQRAIADVLDTADTELKSLQDQLEALQEQKKGLMQKLLTGQVRVKG